MSLMNIDSKIRRYSSLTHRAVRKFVTNPKKFVVDIERYLSRQDWEHANYHHSQSPIPLIDALPNVDLLNLKIDPDLAHKPCLNVLIPGLAMKCMSGGPNTAINLTYRLAVHGIPLRYISTNVAIEPDYTLLWEHFASLTGIKERFPHVEIVCGYDRSIPLMIGENDVFFGTAWWTVQMIKHALYLTKVKKFIYIIQEYEPGLYPWSTLYALALETYGMNFRGIINEPLLAEYFYKNKIGRFSDPNFIQKCSVFEPAVDINKFYPELEKINNQRKKRLLFYARPNAPRNLYELGILAMKKAVEKGAFPADEWELLFIGDNLPPIDLGGGVIIRQNPWLDYNSYAAFLRQSDVGLSLMLSPHTSYPPLEMAACGALLVTNTFSVKTKEKLQDISKNIIPVEPNLESITQGLVEASQRSNDFTERIANSKVKLPHSWDDSFKRQISEVIEMWNDCLSTY